MTNRELRQAVQIAKAETKAALQTVYDSMNPGQQKQVTKDEAVRELFDRYKVEYEE